MGPDKARSLLAADQFATLDRHFSEVQRDYADGLISDVDLRDAFRAFYATDDVGVQLDDPRAIADFTAAANLGDTYAENQLGRYSLKASRVLSRKTAP